MASVSTWTSPEIDARIVALKQTGLSHLGQRDRGPDASLGAEGHQIDPTALGQPA